MKVTPKRANQDDASRKGVAGETGGAADQVRSLPDWD